MTRWEMMRRRLTDLFDKRAGSNISKLLKLAAEPMDELEAVLWQIDVWRDLDQAQGTTLDAIGSNVGQPRGTVSDAIYRGLIRSKIARNLSDGTLDSIIRVLALTLDAPASTIKLEELWEDAVAPSPAALRVADLPAERLNAIGLSTAQVVQIVKSVAPLGVRVETVSFAGTFRLTAGPGPAPAGTGLSDVAMTRGGKLGNVYAGDNADELPI